ncbi:MAG TPA: pyridoxal-phosphate dependent enzyme [Ilumatobacter sp.]|nr:pyridoxal-phosphate dependent enzyme [Ilumatobacter sp.]
MVDLPAIQAARVAGAAVVKHTPVVSSVTLSNLVGGTVALKAENLQRTGAFKIRGAMNKLTLLGPAAAGGVTAGSAGNHAQALAFAASHFGVRCEIFVPAGASISKVAACEAYGAIVHEGGDSLTEAVALSRERAAAAGMVFCHPFDDEAVVAGQGTLGLELLEDFADLACVIVPLGGGGLAAGTAIAVKSTRPEVRIIAVQASACAPYTGAAAPSGPVATLADGIAVKVPGVVTRPLIEAWIDDVVTVEEEAIADAMVLLMERAKLYVEGAGAVGVAALLSGVAMPAAAGITCVVLSGGNVDLGVVPGLIRRHEFQSQRRLSVFVRIDDRPGGLARLLDIFATNGANLIEVEHIREGLDLHIRETGLRATFEVRGADHAARILAAARAARYDVIEETGFTPT